MKNWIIHFTDGSLDRIEARKIEPMKDSNNVVLIDGRPRRYEGKVFEVIEDF